MASSSAPADIRLRLRPPRRRLGRRFIRWQTLQAVFWAAGVLSILGAIFWYAESWRPWLLPIIGLATVTFLIDITIMPTWHYRVHRWDATDDAVYALTGSFTHKWQVVPISRIQSIDTEIGPLQRRLGLATITVTTASSEGKISIEGVNAAEAEETVDRLREITGASPGDAT